MKQDEKELQFPKGFLWGAATSAYQVEGGNTNDWSEWENKNAKRLSREAKTKWADWQQKKFPEMFNPKNYVCGRACGHYSRYEEDFDIAQSLDLNAFRISIEWSRIEPKEGRFDEKEIEHYRKVIKAIRARGMEPFVTLWHFTNPLWLADKGGIISKQFPIYFSTYTKYVVKHLGGLVNYWITFNEPTTIIGMSFASGQWPPQKKNLFSAFKAYKKFSLAHTVAYDEIHNFDATAKVGFGHLYLFEEPYNKSSFLDKISANIADYYANRKITLSMLAKSDFLTVQYYFHDLIKFPLFRKNKNELLSDFGVEIYPEGIYHILKCLKKHNLPIYITENGLADTQDTKRAKFIKDHLRWVHKAIKEDVDVRGYFHWSLLDNFEWDKGFWPRFGLVEVDYKTLKRKIRPSAFEYAKICKSNKLVIK